MTLIRVLILDFDGTVIESNAVKTEAFRYVFSRFPEHAEAMMAFHHAHISMSRFAKFRHLLTRIGKAEDTSLLTDLSEDFSKRVLERMTDVPLVAGAENFLRNVTPRLAVYLVSVTPAGELSVILEQRGLAHWFRDVYGCPPWTKSDAIRDILEREGVEASDALLIGDSAGDQQAAKQTGIKFWARDSGLGFDAPAPPTFSDLNEIERFLEELLP